MNIPSSIALATVSLWFLLNDNSRGRYRGERVCASVRVRALILVPATARLRSLVSAFVCIISNRYLQKNPKKSLRFLCIPIHY